MAAQLSTELEIKLQSLDVFITSHQSAVVGYSGGVDSLFLAFYVCKVLGSNNMVAALAISPSLGESQESEAKEIADSLGIPLQPFDGTEFENPDYVANTTMRCYHCKKDLFSHLKKIQEKTGFKAMFYGANADDSHDYRPGLTAANEEGAIAPLALCKLTKTEIRQLSQYFGLPHWDKPASPCLSSRIPYGSEVSTEKLKQIHEAEKWLKKNGFAECRVRHEGILARIELPVNDWPKFLAISVRNTFLTQIHQLGFKRAVLDLEGFQSGSLNRDVDLLPRREVEHA